jgi:hypothetical protein
MRSVHFIISYLRTAVVFGQINPDWDCPQANHMSSSLQADNLICSFQTPGWIGHSQKSLQWQATRGRCNIDAYGDFRLAYRLVGP